MKSIEATAARSCVAGCVEHVADFCLSAGGAKDTAELPSEERAGIIPELLVVVRDHLRMLDRSSKKL